MTEFHHTIVKNDKLLLTGKVPDTEWTKDIILSTHALRLQIPLVFNTKYVIETKKENLGEDDDEVLVKGTSSLVTIDFSVRIPMECRVRTRGGMIMYDVDKITTFKSHKDEQSFLNLSIPHVNRDRWFNINLAFYKACISADDVAWKSIWAEMTSLAIDEMTEVSVFDERVVALSASTGLPREVAKIIVDDVELASFYENRPFNWSHGSCRCALFALQKCAWTSFFDGFQVQGIFPSESWSDIGSSSREKEAKQLMIELLNDGDITRNDVLEMINEGGLCRAVMTYSTAHQLLHDHEDDWIEIHRGVVRACFLHRTIVDRYELTIEDYALFNDVTKYGLMLLSD